MDTHIPVLLKESIEFLNIKPEGMYVDATIGTGGHAKKIIECLSGSRGLFIGIDCDQEAIDIAKSLLINEQLQLINQQLQESLKGQLQTKVEIFHDNFINLENILKELEISQVDGILFDLGVSSLHLDNASRGFSFRSPGRLDMRMDTRNSLTAEYVINNYSQEQLAEIFFQYGEERQANKIANKIVRLRNINPITSTLELSNIFQDRYGKRIHPATRIFQALRIFINNELDNLTCGLSKAFSVLKSSGRIVVISFHSLEDRIVKHSFIDMEKKGKCRILTRKPVIPTTEEIKTNPRSRSAKLRALEKL